MKHCVTGGPSTPPTGADTGDRLDSVHTSGCSKASLSREKRAREGGREARSRQAGTLRMEGEGGMGREEGREMRGGGGKEGSRERREEGEEGEEGRGEGGRGWGKRKG